MKSQIIFFLLIAVSLAGGPVRAENGSGSDSCAAEFKASFAAGQDLERTRKAVEAMRAAGMVLPTEAKAVLINQDKSKAGIIIEVGTPQKVIYYLDRSGQRSNTIIDSGSRNGKKVSNRRYQKSKTGFVSLERLNSILDVETNELAEMYIEDPEQDADFPSKTTRFFVFGDTVSTGAHGDGHAWVGIRFQLEPLGPWQTIKMHVRMLDDSTDKQSDALGVLGNNLIYAIFNQTHTIEEFMAGMKENITAEDHGRLEVDGMHFEGEHFKQWTDDRVAVALLASGLSDAVLMTAEGNFVPPSQHFYKKNVVLHQLQPDMANAVGKEVWATGARAYAQSTQTAPEDLRLVNWLPIQSLGQTGLGGVDQALAAIQGMRVANEPLILTRFGSLPSLADWNRIFKVNNMGILKEGRFPEHTTAGLGSMAWDNDHQVEYLIPKPKP